MCAVSLRCRSRCGQRRRESRLLLFSRLSFVVNRHLSRLYFPAGTYITMLDMYHGRNYMAIAILHGHNQLCWAVKQRVHDSLQRI